MYFTYLKLFNYQNKNIFFLPKGAVLRMHCINEFMSIRRISNKQQANIFFTHITFYRENDDAVFSPGYVYGTYIILFFFEGGGRRNNFDLSKGSYHLGRL